MAHIALEQTGDHFTSMLDNIVPGLSPIVKSSLQIFHLDWNWIISRCVVLFAFIAAVRPVFGEWQKYLTDFFTSSIFVDSDDMFFHCMLAFIIDRVGSGQIRYVKARTNEQARWTPESENTNISNTSYVNFSKMAAKIPVIFEPYERGIVFRWKGRWFFFRRDVHRSQVRFIPSESITLTVLGWSKEPLQRIFLEARHEYYSPERCETSVWRPTSKEERNQGGPLWTVIAKRPSRPIDTVILPDSLKSELLSDLNTFWGSSNRSQYANRGIPYRRGYLFTGPPGTGKSSCAFALAGFFGVDAYVLSLNDSAMTEDLLFRLQSKLPRHSILLLEDIDRVSLLQRSDQQSVDESRCGVSLAGLLNAIDGVASQEGRALINHPERLDKALIRPGRVDRTFHFGLATKDQIKKLFLQMYNDDEGKPESTVHNDLTKDYDLVELAKKFTDELQENAFSPADVQGYLLIKKDPRDAVKDVGKWRDEQITEVQSQEHSSGKAQLSK
jgi:chaperone BCS1